MTTTTTAHAFGLPADVSLYSPFPKSESSETKKGVEGSVNPFGVRSGLNIRLAGDCAAVVEWGNYIVFAKASGPRQATGALVGVGRQHDRLALDVNVAASSVGVTKTEQEKRDADAICEDLSNTITSGLSAVVVAEHYPKSVLPLNVSVVSCPPGGFSAERVLPCAMAAAMTATALCVHVSDILSVVNIASRGNCVLADPTLGEDLPDGDKSERQHLTTLGLTYVSKEVLLLRSLSSSPEVGGGRDKTKPNMSKILSYGFAATTQVSKEIERVIGERVRRDGL